MTVCFKKKKVFLSGQLASVHCWSCFLTVRTDGAIYTLVPSSGLIDLCEVSVLKCSGFCMSKFKQHRVGMLANCK